MRKILIVSEEPDKNAIYLKHNELFGIVKNPFSQFFGRLLFGTEKNYRRYFNENNLLWMHALGSNCHGSPENDGERAITIKAANIRFALIVLFGGKARQIFFKRWVNDEAISIIFRDGPKKIIDVKNYLTPKLGESIPCNDTYIVCFPHPSGRAQGEWMKFPYEYSLCLQYMQDRVFQSCNVEQIQGCKTKKEGITF